MEGWIDRKYCGVAGENVVRYLIVSKMFNVSELKKNTEYMADALSGACQQGLRSVHVPLLESNRQILVMLTQLGFIPNTWYSVGPFNGYGDIRVFLAYKNGKSYINHLEYVGLEVPFEEFRDDPEYEDVIIVFVRRVGIITRAEALTLESCVGQDIVALIEICHL